MYCFARLNKPTAYTLTSIPTFSFRKPASKQGIINANSENIATNIFLFFFNPYSAKNTQDNDNANVNPGDNTNGGTNANNGGSTTVVSKPLKVNLTSAKNVKTKSLKIKWKKVKGTKGYEIWYSTKKDFKSGVKKKITSKLNITIKKLKKNKRYYVKVRAYKLSKGKKLYGSFSKTKSDKVKR